MFRNVLEGKRVLDFTQIGAGPTCTMYLADLGAEVIKVEPPEGDIGRRLGPPWYKGRAAIFVAFNRGKRSICLNLKDPADRKVALELAARADVLAESFRPGVLEKLGLGYEVVKAINPRIIYCSVTAYGQSGPARDEAGVDGIIQSTSGLMGLIGSDGDEPSKVQAPVADVTTGFIATIGVLAQMLETERTGVGAYLDVSLFASAVALQQSAVTSYLAEGEIPGRLGSAAPYSAPNEAFETADGWIMVAAYMGDRWERLCKALGVEELHDDPRFVTSTDRVHNRKAMRAALRPAFLAKPVEEWIGILKAADILCSKVSSYADLLANPQLEHLGMISSEHHPVAGEFRMPAFPINSRAPASVRRAPPDLGEHTQEILEELGLSLAERP